ncbi:MAG: hypothetical protein WCO45_10900 [Pseudanabaena sp. ELA607]
MAHHPNSPSNQPRQPQPKELSARATPTGESPLHMLMQSKDASSLVPIKPLIPIDPRNQFTWSNLFLILSIPALIYLLVGGSLLLYNPLLFAWLYAPRAPIVYGSLWSQPKTLQQIRGELEEKSLIIGDVIKLESGEQIFSILEKETKSIQELRLYQSVSDRGVEKFVSLQTVRIYALEDAFVRQVRSRYAVKSVPSSRQPWLMQKIESLRGQPPRHLPGNLYWFSVTGSRDKMRYGQIFYFTTTPRPRLVSTVEWNSPVDQLPQWQNVLTASGNQPQLLVNQTHNYEPLFVVFQPEVDPSNQNSIQLRRITLNEANLNTESVLTSIKISLDRLGLTTNTNDLIKNTNKTTKSATGNSKEQANDSKNSNGEKPAKSENLGADKTERQKIDPSPNNKSDQESNQGNTRSGSRLPHTPYQQALWLASVGLWQDAQVKMAAYKATLPDQKLPPFLQEQADLITFHARLTHNQAMQERGHIGDQALTLILDGQWEAALVLLREKRSQGGKFAEMLIRDYPHIWQRVEVALAMEPVPAVKIWGGLVVLHRDGLRAAERWFKEQKAYTPEAMELLQRLDLAPVALKPEQILGRVVFLGKEKPDPDWFLPPPALEANQGWYEVTIDVVRDGDVWRNAPLPMLADRSGLLLWRLFGFDRNNKMSILLKDEDGESRTAFLTIHSIYVNSAGELRLLAAADLNIARMLNRRVIPPLVSNRGGAVPPDGTTVYLHDLSLGVAMSMVRSLYTDLSRRGQLSVDLQEFVSKAQQWQFIRVDLRGTGTPYLMLQLERSQVDLGERFYPITLIYNSDGTLLFSDVVNTERIWLGLLPSKVSGQSLTFSNGRYEVWVVR